jgi:hypothetical protein
METAPLEFVEGRWQPVGQAKPLTALAGSDLIDALTDGGMMPCSEGKAFLEHQASPQEAWDACRDPYWMLWFIDHCCLPSTGQYALAYAAHAKVWRSVGGLQNFTSHNGYAESCDAMRKLFPDPLALWNNRPQENA